MKNNEETQRYSFQKWEEMLQLRKESGLTVRAWCSEQGISERVYYYRLQKLRQVGSQLELDQEMQLAEVPLAPKAGNGRVKFRLTTKAGILVMEADQSVLDQVLGVMLYAE